MCGSPGVTADCHILSRNVGSLAGIIILQFYVVVFLHCNSYIDSHVALLVENLRPACVKTGKRSTKVTHVNTGMDIIEVFFCSLSFIDN